MTLQQRDELAKMAGGKIDIPEPYRGVPLRAERVYRWSGGKKTKWNGWHPETSRDDCQPLLEEIERRGLWDKFLWHIPTPEDALSYSKTAQVIRYYWFMLSPADIVAAFRQTIEEADGKEGE